MWEVCQQKVTNIELIRRAFSRFDSQRVTLQTALTKTQIFLSTILNILSSFVRYEFIVCDNKDPPSSNKK